MRVVCLLCMRMMAEGVADETTTRHPTPNRLAVSCSECVTFRSTCCFLAKKQQKWTACSLPLRSKEAIVRVYQDIQAEYA
jgi:hypothetical protein